MGAIAEQRRTKTRFLKEAVDRIRNRRLLTPALLMLAVVTLSNIVLLLNLPREGELPSVAAILAIIARLGGLAVVGVALLRILTQSSRPPWQVDKAFLIYLLAMLVSLTLFSVIAHVLGASWEPLPLLLRSIVNTVLSALIAPWIVGLAVATPLGVDPRRFLRRFRLWLPQLIGWSLLIVTPLALVHGLISFRLLRGAGDLFWPLAFLDGALSLAVLVFGFALNATAYERAVSDGCPTLRVLWHE